MPVESITSYDQFKSIIDSDTTSVIDFWAPWCGPCKAISPVLDQISEETSGINFYKLNIDDVPNAAEEVSIRVVPTFLAFKNGSKIIEHSGANPSGLKAFVAQAAL